MEVIEVAGKLLGLAVADLGAESASEDEDTCWSREGSGASYEGGASEEDDGAGGKRKRMSADDRKARNRERNRLHARKTRQRKKQHVQELQLKIWGLRQERQRLLQLSTEHRTAGVLLALSCSPKQCVQGLGSPGGGAAPRSPPALKLPAPAGRDWARELAAHEEALRKITQEFESMDGSQQVGDDNGVTFDDGGGAGRGTGGSSKGSRGGKGTLADRTALRRERNRMHAKRTRNRKKLFVEACSVMIDKMKVENAQLEHEILASGVRLPQDVWADEGQETVPEEPLPEYLAALWDFAEGKTHSPKPPATGPATPSQTAETTTPTASFSARHSRQTSSSSSSSSSTLSNSSFSSASTGVSNANYPAPPSSPQLEPMSSLTAAAAAAGLPGQALEDASTLCAFMEVAQTRAAKRTRVRPTQADDGGGRRQQPPRVWSDHGSTTSESRGSLESDEEAANERKGADRQSLSTGGAAGVGGGNVSSSSGGNGGAVMSPAFWTSRQVLERYALPRQVC